MRGGNGRVRGYPADESLNPVDKRLFLAGKISFGEGRCGDLSRPWADFEQGRAELLCASGGRETYVP